MEAAVQTLKMDPLENSLNLHISIKPSYSVWYHIYKGQRKFSSRDSSIKRCTFCVAPLWYVVIGLAAAQGMRRSPKFWLTLATDVAPRGSPCLRMDPASSSDGSSFELKLKTIFNDLNLIEFSEETKTTGTIRDSRNPSLSRTWLSGLSEHYRILLYILKFSQTSHSVLN